MVALFFHHALIRPSRITLRPPACSMIKTPFIQNSSLGAIHKKHTSKACLYFEACRPAASLITAGRRRQKAIGCLPPTWNFLKACKRVPDSSNGGKHLHLKESNRSIELCVLSPSHTTGTYTFNNLRASGDCR